MAQLAFAYAAFNLAYAALAIPAGALLAGRTGRSCWSRWATYTLVYAGFAYADAAWQLWLLFIAYGLYFAAAEGTLKAWVSSLVPPERRGAAYGLFAIASGALVLPASVLAGVLWDRYGPRPAFLLGAIAEAAALAVVALSPGLRDAPRPPRADRGGTYPQANLALIAL